MRFWDQPVLVTDFMGNKRPETYEIFVVSLLSSETMTVNSRNVNCL